jgi:hypothetical protein
LQDRLRGGEVVVAKQRPESAQNRASGLPAELLVDDGIGERLERRETAGCSMTGPTRSISPAIAGSARSWAGARLLTG